MDATAKATHDIAKMREALDRAFTAKTVAEARNATRDAEKYSAAVSTNGAEHLTKEQLAMFQEQLRRLAGAGPGI